MKTQLSKILLKLIDKILSGLKKLRARLAPQDFYVANGEDIYYYYRLFLNRPPDPDGYNFYLNLVNREGYTIGELTDSFSYSEEFQWSRIVHSQPTLVELPKFQLYVKLNDFYIGAAIARYKIYEAHITQTLCELFQPEYTFLDIGANIGYFSMLAAAHLGPEGRVIAFEPSEENCKLFTESMKINNFQNIELFPYAVSDSAQTYSLVGGAWTTNNHLASLDENLPNTTQVEAVALDKFLQDLNKVDIIKMDIEGAEPLALNGMCALIEKHRPQILSEFSPDMIPKISDVEPIEYLNQFIKLGYILQIIYHNGDKSKKMIPQEILTFYEETSNLAHLDLLMSPI